jgi:hypothetical protein
VCRDQRDPDLTGLGRSGRGQSGMPEWIIRLSVRWAALNLANWRPVLPASRPATCETAALPRPEHKKEAIVNDCGCGRGPGGYSYVNSPKGVPCLVDRPVAVHRGCHVQHLGPTPARRPTHGIDRRDAVFRIVDTERSVALIAAITVSATFPRHPPPRHHSARPRWQLTAIAATHSVGRTGTLDDTRHWTRSTRWRNSSALSPTAK